MHLLSIGSRQNNSKSIRSNRDLTILRADEESQLRISHRPKPRPKGSAELGTRARMSRRYENRPNQSHNGPVLRINQAGINVFGKQIALSSYHILGALFALSLASFLELLLGSHELPDPDRDLGKQVIAVR
jgi:hypothetical protein